jgi:hypothetical protein
MRSSGARRRMRWVAWAYHGVFVALRSTLCSYRECGLTCRTKVEEV